MNIREKIEFVKKKIKPMTREEILEEKNQILANACRNNIKSIESKYEDYLKKYDEQITNSIEKIYQLLFSSFEHKFKSRILKDDSRVLKGSKKAAELSLADAVGIIFDSINRLIIYLEENFFDFKECLLHWISSIKSEILQFRNSKISEKLAILELKRGWSSIKYALTNDESAKQNIEKYLQKIKIHSSRLERGFLPSVSLDLFQEKSNELKIKISFRGTETIQDVINIFGIQNYTINGNTLEATISEGKKKELLDSIYKLSDLNTTSILFGEFGILAHKDEQKIFSPEFNRIYGSGFRADGFLPTVFTRLNRGGKPYYCPDGWRRYSLCVENSPSEFDRKYGNWPVAYHGTATFNAVSILSGIAASLNGCYGSNGVPRIYFSPSIEYSGHPRYASPFKVKGKWVQMVLQTRISPKNINEIKPGTLPGAFNSDASRADINFNNNELEWISYGKLEHKTDYVIYGVMVRVFNGSVRDNPRCLWWGNEYLGKYN